MWKGKRVSYSNFLDVFQVQRNHSAMRSFSLPHLIPVEPTVLPCRVQSNVDV